MWIYDRDPIPPIARYLCDRVLAEKQTRWQHVGIYQLRRYGRTLFLDGSLQSAESDERRYHESLIHPAMLTHPAPQRVLIAGGGEGATLRETLKHPSVRQVDMADLDAELVALCRRHLPAWSAGAFEDPRVRLRHVDARKLIERARAQYDVIVSDLPEPRAAEPSLRLYTVEFYRAVRRALRPGGLFVAQCGPVDEISRALFLTIRATLQRVFPHVCGYWTRMPSFREPWGFLTASFGPDPAALHAAEIASRLRARGIKSLAWYGPRRHERMFRLPPAVTGRRQRTPSTDARPFAMD